MSVERVNGTTVASQTEPRIDPRAQAEAEAIRIRAQADADAVKIKAAEEAERQRLENEKQALAVERNALRFRREKAVEEAKIADALAKKEEIDRAREAAARAAEEQQQAEAQAATEVAEAENRWRGYARSFYIVCAIVALPVQVAAFYNPRALWLMAAPLMLEGGAWVVLKGAAAAVAAHRPHWHYRLIAWLLAFIAAGINLWHGLNAFDPATAIGTAFASVAGPGVWDLHEHGRIRTRDGVPTRQERKAAEKEAKRIAAEKAAEEKRQRAEKQATEEAARRAAEELDQIRREEFPEVHKHARRLAAAWGENGITPAAWRQAHIDIEGTEPGESAEVIRARNVAAKRVESARTGTPVSTLSKTTNAQRVPHLPKGPGRGSKTGPKVRGVRRSGDSQQFSDVARRQASIAARNAATKDSQ